MKIQAGDHPYQKIRFVQSVLSINTFFLILTGRDVSLLSELGKVYDRMLIKRIREDIAVICMEQGGFRRGKGCVD